MRTYADRHAEQCEHLRAHQPRVAGHIGDDEVSVYLIDYAGPHHDIYQRLCADIGIEPKAAICHPDPYGDTP